MIEIYRLSFGIIWFSPTVKWWRRIFNLDYQWTHCECHALEIGPFYFNWAKGECYFPNKADRIKYGTVDIDEEEQNK